MSFNELLEAVNKLSDDEHEMFVEIVRRREIDRRRAQLVKDVKKARREYRAGKCKVATPAEIMREILS